MRVVLLNPPFLPRFSRFSRSPAVTKSGTIYYPIWHAYAAGLLQQRGHEVLLLDAPADNLSRAECLQRIRGFAPELAVVFTSTPSIHNDAQAAGEIKEIAPRCLVLLSGPHVTALPEESLMLDARVDGVALGEYDMTLLELAEGRAPHQVAGLTCRNGEGCSSTPSRAMMDDLDALPFVSRVYKEHLQIRNYFYAHCRYPVVSIFTSRGCPARCSYCLYPQQMFGHKLRQRSAENIVEEFRYIEKELPDVREVLIDDDTFSIRQEHTLEVCELMLRHKVRIPWTAECRANLNYETMSAMKRAGCRLVVIGFESADDGILRNIRKGGI